MTKPLPAKAEVALEYPDKLYIGTFDRDSRFDAHLDGSGLSLMLERVGDADTRKSIHMHLNFELFAEIFRDVARTVARSARRCSYIARLWLMQRALLKERLPERSDLVEFPL